MKELNNEMTTEFLSRYAENKSQTERDLLTQNDHLMNKNYQRDQETTDMFFNAPKFKLNFGKKIYEFYNAPITKFWQSVIFHMIFLGCFSYMILVKTPPKPSGVEIFVLIYIFTFGFDKIREVFK